MHLYLCNHCPINEQTADGVPVGRCWFYLGPERVCPRHGDVSVAVAHFEATGQLTLERDHRASQPRKD